jgi:phosphoribosylformimino-5-aminoimidazole carboxamide ribotide isomerase
MRIIPAIDIIDGKCVRLSKGDYNTQIIYNENPLEVAKQFEDAGIEYLHLVDLDGAKARKVINHKILYDIARFTSLQIDFGGGLRSSKDVASVFDNGASQITGGSIAVEDQSLFLQWIEQYTSTKIILGADAHHRKIATHGWTASSETDVVDYITGYVNKGIKYVVCTDIAKDGMLQGPSDELYKEILATVDVKLIASGGVSCLDDLIRLKSLGCEGAIVGKAIYENKITLKELQSLC